MLVSQHAPVVERFIRQSNGDWILTVYKGVDTALLLTSVQLELRLSDIYRFVDWSAAKEYHD